MVDYSKVVLGPYDDCAAYLVVGLVPDHEAAIHSMCIMLCRPLQLAGRAARHSNSSSSSQDQDGSACQFPKPTVTLSQQDTPLMKQRPNPSRTPKTALLPSKASLSLKDSMQKSQLLGKGCRSSRDSKASLDHSSKGYNMGDMDVVSCTVPSPNSQDDAVKHSMRENECTSDVHVTVCTLPNGWGSNKQTGHTDQVQRHIEPVVVHPSYQSDICNMGSYFPSDYPQLSWQASEGQPHSAPETTDSSFDPSCSQPRLPPGFNLCAASGSWPNASMACAHRSINQDADDVSISAAADLSESQADLAARLTAYAKAVGLRSCSQPEHAPQQPCDERESSSQQQPIAESDAADQMAHEEQQQTTVDQEPFYPTYMSDICNLAGPAVEADEHLQQNTSQHDAASRNSQHSNNQHRTQALGLALRYSQQQQYQQQVASNSNATAGQPTAHQAPLPVRMSQSRLPQHPGPTATASSNHDKQGSAGSTRLPLQPCGAVRAATALMKSQHTRQLSHDTQTQHCTGAGSSSTARPGYLPADISQKIGRAITKAQAMLPAVGVQRNAFGAEFVHSVAGDKSSGLSRIPRAPGALPRKQASAKDALSAHDSLQSDLRLTAGGVLSYGHATQVAAAVAGRTYTVTPEGNIMETKGCSVLTTPMAAATGPAGGHDGPSAISILSGIKGRHNKDDKGNSDHDAAVGISVQTSSSLWPHAASEGVVMNSLSVTRALDT